MFMFMDCKLVHLGSSLSRTCRVYLGRRLSERLSNFAKML